MRKRETELRAIKIAAACLVFFAAAQPAAVFGSSAQSKYERLTNSANIDREEEDEEESKSSRERREEREDEKRDYTTGPGAVIEEETEPEAKTQEASLKETYHEEFGVYEQNLQDTFFIYTTVENGGITDQSVTVEFPANMMVRMQKDGVDMPYVSGQPLTERGSYVFRFEGNMNGEGETPRVYKTTFRCRIQEKLPKPEGTDEESEIYHTSGAYNGIPRDYSYNDARENGVREEQSQELSGETEEQRGEMTLWEDPDSLETAPEEETTGEESQPAEIMDQDGQINEEILEEAISEAVGSIEQEEEIEGYKTANGLSQAYYEEGGVYVQTLLTGASFQTQIPNGTTTNHGVSLRTEDPISFRILKDGEEIEYEAGAELTEAGSYTVFPSQDTTLYISSYSGKQEPVFQFRIAEIGVPVHDLGVVNAPLDAAILAVEKDGTDAGNWNQDFARLWEDGTYDITFSTPAGELYLTVERDTVAPRFYMAEAGKKMEISYVDPEDVAYCILEKEGEDPVRYQGAVELAEDPGEYTLSAFDAAGNMAQGSFSIAYSFNMGAVAAIVLVVVLLGAGIYFVMTINRKMKVR